MKNRPFYGWWVVFAATVGLFWGPPIAVFCFSVFLKPLMHDFHAGRSAVSLAFTLQLVTASILAPLVGWLIDRFGTRRVILPATAIFGAVLLLARLFSSSMFHLYFFYVSLGLLLGGVGPIPYGTVISRWFDRRRGLALGLMMFGIGSGAIILLPVAQNLISRFGWRNAYAILGVAVLVVSLPVTAMFLKERPQDMGLLPDGALPADSADAGDASTLGMSGDEAVRSRTFWLMVCAFCLASASVQGCAIHMVAMLTDHGIAAQTAALGTSLLGAAVLIGRVGTGYLLDRFFAPHIAAGFFCSAAIGIGLLWMGSSAGIAFAGAFLVGLGLGAEIDIIAYLVSRYFGLHFFGQIYSLVFASFTLSGAVGPLLMGAGFDRTGSYQWPLAALFIATMAAAGLMTFLGPYRYHVNQPS